MNFIIVVITMMRVKQWTKNLIIFVPLFFSGGILDSTSFLRAFYAFFAMCLLSSSIYILNDIFDRKHDLEHPIKRYRALPAGLISVPAAILVAILLFIAALLTNIVFVASEYFLVLQLAYFLLMIAYSVWLKHISIIDAIIIAGGFLIRALAGAVIFQIDITAMFSMSVIGGALLISFGKRAAELSSLTQSHSHKHRPALIGYSQKALDSIISALVAVTFFSYVLLCYDFYKLSLDSRIVDLLPPAMRSSQWLMLTVPIAFYGLSRYLFLIYRGDAASRPEELWFKDRPLLFTFLIWSAMLFVLIYFKEVFEVFKIFIHLF